MREKTHNLSIRLLRAGKTPETAIRVGVVIKDWSAFNGAKIATGALGGGPPGWTDFLGLTADDKDKLRQTSAFGLAFLLVDNRWFALAFGLGHVKLDPAAVEQDFGLRVVVNAVDHTKLRSADLRTPDANTLSRRSQTSRGSERNAFEIDPERDIVRGLLGEPKDKRFASKISGNDALTIRRKLKLADLPAVCTRALELSALDDYKTEFGWIDQIRHVREPATIAALETKLVEALTAALKKPPADVDDISLAYPSIYDPDKADWVTFRGFKLRTIYPDLEIAHYLAGIATKCKGVYEVGFLTRHFVQECDETGKTPGQSWPIQDCLVFETEIDGQRYTLSGGRWYRIDPDLAKEVLDYFAAIEKVELPAAEAGDNEKRYNARLAGADNDLLSLDVKLVKPSDASSPIEVCDFLGKDKRLIHIKDKAESSRLSHLFNQGLISAVTLKRDRSFRDRVRQEIVKQPGGADYERLIPPSGTELLASDYKVVFGVLVNSSVQHEPTLPFFSLISFRHAARRIADELGYKVAFAWIRKPGAGIGKKPARGDKAGPPGGDGDEGGGN
jgi:uncharacterized protein (TIGR04141 family)